MADLASASPDLAHETVDAVAPEPNLAAPDGGDDNLLGELARAMHAAATSQYQRLTADLDRRRSEQVTSITERASAEAENLKAGSEGDIGAIDAWAKTEAEKIKLERLRRIDARREQLAAELGREDTIREREIFAIEVAIDAHRNEMELFFGRLERETDPSAIARVASTMPAFPSLSDVAEHARRNAAAEFATIESQALPATASGLTAIASATPDAIAERDDPIVPEAADVTDAAATAEVPATADERPIADDAAGAASGAELEPATAVSESRLQAVMDPSSSRDETPSTQPWEAPYVVSVAAGTGSAEEEAVPMSVGSTLLRTVRSIRPMASRHEKDGEGGTPS